MPKAASYTYFPRVKDLSQESSLVEPNGNLSQEDFTRLRHGERASDSSSGGSTPTSEDPPEIPLQMPQLRPGSSRRSSRFLPFSSRSRDPSAEPRPDRSRSKTVKKADSPGSSPARSLTKLRRKSWTVSQQPPQATSFAPGEEKTSLNKDDVKNQTTAETSKRKTPTTSVSIPEEPEATHTPSHEPQPVPMSKKNKRLSSLFNATVDAPPVPAIPKSFSTEKLPIYPHAHSPISPTHAVPPLPRHPSTDKLKGVKTEPRKKDELWTVFRTLDADLRKQGFPT